MQRCAWCESTMGHADPSTSEEITHGMCQACTENLLEEVRSESFWEERHARDEEFAVTTK